MISIDKVVVSVANNVSNKIDPNKKKLAVLAICDLIASDDDIQPDTIVDLYSRIQKVDIIETREFYFDGFIAGCLMYIVASTNNSEGRSCTKDFDFSAYVNGFIDRCDEIILANTPTVEPYIQFSVDSNTDIMQALEGLLGQLNEMRPASLKVPTDSTYEEMVYVTELLKAYADAEDADSLLKEQLEDYPGYKNHFNRQRKDYYAAESVRRNMRDVFGNKDEGCFAELKNEAYDGIIDTCEEDYPHGYARLQRVLGQAGSLDVSGCALGKLGKWIRVSEKKGVCHMLVNDHRIKWVIPDE